MMISEAYRDPKLARELLGLLHRLAQALDQPAVFMEVCGTHTMSIYRSGIRDVLPRQIRLISGPGCPVCVSGADYIDRALLLAETERIAIASFGDLMRVPGSRGSLAAARARGADIHVVYSPLDALRIAQKKPQATIVFLAVGFETTAPGIGAAVERAKRDGITNFKLLTALKTIPHAMRALATDPEIGVHGFLCPGHVSAVIGCDAYQPLVDGQRIPCVVAGFEPVDILAGLVELTRQRIDGQPRLVNLYPRAVRAAGNERARQLLDRVFDVDDAMWRGIGCLPRTGLRLAAPFRDYDAAVRYPFDIVAAPEPAGCLCGRILKGIAEPVECQLLGTICSPDSPVGACMVSSEGACAAYYRYAYRG